MGHFSRGCTKEKPAEEEPEEEIVYGAGTQDTTEEPAPSGKMGVWGGNSEAVLDPVGTWASGVAEDTMGGW